MHGIRRAAGLVLVILFCLLATLWLTGSQRALADDVTASYAGPTITFLPAEVARQRGFFREQNLDIKYLLTRTEADRAALASGDLDYTLRAGSTFVSAARGLPVRVIFLGTTKPFWGLVVRPEIKTVKELKEKSVGIPGLLGSQHISAKAILRQHGLDPDRDVIYRVVEVGARIAAVHAGSIDSSMMDYGEAFRAKKLGLKMLVNAADSHGLLAGGVGANLRKLRDQPEQVKRFLKAMVQALKYMQENPEGTQQVMMSFLKIDREMAGEIYQMSINNFTKTGTVEESTMNLLVERLLADAGIKGLPVSRLTDFALLQQVLKQF
jgi:ABC-type nitrate/sulfonate/bicarbonate transport system substrate-binding protein